MNFFWSYIDSFGGPNFWNRLQNIHNFWSCNLVWDIEQLDIGDYLLDWAISRDGLKIFILNFKLDRIMKSNKMQKAVVDEMKIASTCENEKVFQRFGHTAQLKFYDVVEGRIVTEDNVDTKGSGQGALVELLSGWCGGCFDMWRYRRW